MTAINRDFGLVYLTFDQSIPRPVRLVLDGSSASKIDDTEAWFAHRTHVRGVSQWTWLHKNLVSA